MKLCRRVRDHLQREAISGAIILAAALLALPGYAQVKLLPLRVHIGEKAPEFSLPSTSGKQVKLSNFEGRTVLLDFYEGYW